MSRTFESSRDVADGGHRDLAGERRQRVRGLDVQLLRRSASTRRGWPPIPSTCAPAPCACWRAVVQVFGAAQAHHGYLFANARGTRVKLLVHDGFGV